MRLDQLTAELVRPLMHSRSVQDAAHHERAVAQQRLDGMLHEAAVLTVTILVNVDARPRLLPAPFLEKR